MIKLKNIMKNRKFFIFITIILVLLFILFLIFILSKKKEKDYLATPIEQTTLSKSAKKVLFNNQTKWSVDSNYYLWEVKKDVKLEKIKEIANAKNFQLKYSKEGYTYQWEKNSDKIIYNLSTNILTILGSDIITLEDLSSVTSETFSSIASKYFNSDWDYEIFETEKREKGETVYFAKRIIDKRNRIEIGSHKHQTDYIAIKNDQIVYARFLLAEFGNTKQIVPLLPQKELEKYVNQDKYPKSVYPKTDVLNNDPVFEDIEYVTNEYNKVLGSINNCQVENTNIVYLYQNISQKYLTPVYRLDTICQMTYKDNSYFVPSIWYVNAIEPNLIISEEK